MIDKRSEIAQILLDKASTRRIDRRKFMSWAVAIGALDLMSPQILRSALAAGANQEANRKNLRKQYDYVVVGAGAAGCIIADRLSETGASVLVVEAGGDDTGDQIDEPSVWFTNIGGPRDWAYMTEAEPALNDRSIPIVAGRVLGGGTSINASVWVHGFADDFDGWARNGCAGWSYKDVLPFYRKMEDWAGGANEWRGAGGPMPVRLPDDPHPTALAWIEGSRQMGVPTLDDMNAPMREGSGFTNMTINPDGSRASASRSYLRPALERSNLTLLLNTMTTRLLFNGQRCRGVQIERGGQLLDIEAGREVIVTAGGVGSARLLLLSGVGPAEELRALGIEPVIDLPGVGRNFQDHPLFQGVVFSYKGDMPPRRTGSNAVEATAFLRSNASLDVPDIQPVLIQLPLIAPALKAEYGQLPPDAFTIAPGLVRPQGRGSVKLKSSDFRNPPLVNSGFLSTEGDLEASMRCIEWCRELGHQQAFDAIRDKELVPGKALSKAALAGFARNSATSYFHPVGTCKMGIDDMAVVDPELNVRGIENLRVCDSAVMPTITTGNTNAPSQLIGAKAASLIIDAI